MQIAIRFCDDWVALYRDGVKVEENHSCSVERGLEALGIPHTVVEVEVDDMGQGVDGSDPFPETI